MSADIRVYRGLDEARGRFGPSAVTIGNFDGVHRGHQALMAALRGHGARPSVITFDPHPTSVVAPARAPKLLSTFEQRLRWMADEGIEQVLLIPFDKAFAAWAPDQFVDRVLVEAAGAQLVVVGDNFHFGVKQSGTAAMLIEIGVSRGFETRTVTGVTWRGHAVSSTEVRRAVESGDASLAARLLGRPYEVEGEVVRGHGIGARETVPTLNLATHAEVLPARGVYVTRVRCLDSDRSWPSVTNVGVRPTFGGEELTIESFVLGPLEAPPERIAVAFLRRVRAERKFADAAALKAQILRDAGRAQAFHRRVARLG